MNYKLIRLILATTILIPYWLVLAVSVYVFPILIVAIFLESINIFHKLILLISSDKKAYNNDYYKKEYIEEIRKSLDYIRVVAFLPFLRIHYYLKTG